MRQLRICPAKGYFTNKLDVLSQNDPFVNFQMGEQKYQTKTYKDKRVAEWTQQFIVEQKQKSSDKNILKIQAMDQDQFLHQQIGVGTVDLNPYFQANQYAELFVSLKTKQGFPAGKMLIKIMPMGYVPDPNVKPKKLRSNQTMKWYVPPNQRANQPYQGQFINNNQPAPGINNYITAPNQLDNNFQQGQQPQQPQPFQPQNHQYYQNHQNIIKTPQYIFNRFGSIQYQGSNYVPPQSYFNQAQPQSGYMNENQYRQYVSEQPQGSVYVHPTNGRSIMAKRESQGFRQKMHNKIQGLGQRFGKHLVGNTRDTQNIYYD